HYVSDDRGGIRRHAVDQRHSERNGESEHYVHERPAEHHKELLPSRPQLVELGFGNLFFHRFSAFERSGELVAIQFYVSSERYRGNSIVRVAKLDAPNSRPQTEERICLDAHPKELCDDEMAELMDVDGNAQDKNNG